MVVKICYGWAVVLGGPIELGGREGYKLRLTENSFSPNTIILWYPKDLIYEYES